MGVLLVLATQCDCARSHAQSQRMTQACGILAQSVANQESAFVARVQAVRGRHILLREYDRQMIALIEERRRSLQATLLTDSSADEGAAGCSGQQLEDLRSEAIQEMVRLQGFLATFRKGLREDPAGVFIDAR